MCGHVDLMPLSKTERDQVGEKTTRTLKLTKFWLKASFLLLLTKISVAFTDRRWEMASSPQTQHNTRSLMRLGVLTFHSFSSLDQLGNWAGYFLWQHSQLLPVLCSRLLQNLEPHGHTELRFISIRQPIRVSQAQINTPQLSSLWFCIHGHAINLIVLWL